MRILDPLHKRACAFARNPGCRGLGTHDRVQVLRLRRCLMVAGAVRCAGGCRYALWHRRFQARGLRERRGRLGHWSRKRARARIVRPFSRCQMRDARE